MENYEKEITHFSHPEHPLVLKKGKGGAGGENDRKTCFGCLEQILNTTAGYSCSQHCNFHLHVMCAKLPKMIDSHLDRRHYLSLVASQSFNRKTIKCTICPESLKGFFYLCATCVTAYHVKCVFPPCLLGLEQHRFVGLVQSVSLNSFSFTCSFCGTGGSDDTKDDDSPCLCTVCQVIVHKICKNLLKTIRIQHHQHPLSHSYFLKQYYGQPSVRGPSCGICLKNIDTYYGGYHCIKCRFLAHVKCATEYSTKPDPQRARVMHCLESEREPSFSVVREIPSADGNNIVVEMKHFAHDCNLHIIGSDHDEQEGAEEICQSRSCNACMVPLTSLSPPYYSCRRCDFFLHKSCTEFPTITTVLDSRAQFLIPKAPTIDGIFQCKNCKQFSQGFLLARGIHLSDVRCGHLFSQPLEHRSHEHPLFMTPYKGVVHCNACKGGANIGTSHVSDQSAEPNKDLVFRCSACDFNLDLKCATLPYKLRHRFDKHDLHLSYSPFKDGSYQSYCDICEEERDRELWFYGCEECDFTVHPDCILGKNPYVKLGGSYECAEFHPHPLTLVQPVKEKQYPLCSSCHETCDDLALKCTVLGCDFLVHRKRESCTPPPKQEEIEKLVRQILLRIINKIRMQSNMPQMSSTLLMQ